MKIFKVISLCLVAVLISSTGLVRNVNASSHKDSSNGKIIIKYKNDVLDEAKEKIEKEYNIEDYKEIKSLNMAIIKIEDCEDILNIVEELDDMEDIEYAELDYSVDVDIDEKKDNDEEEMAKLVEFNTEKDSKSGLSWSLKDLDVEKAWEITKGSEDVVVGLLGGGVYYKHPDLIDAIWVNENEVPDDGIDNDNNGYIDDVHGWNFAYDNNVIDKMDHYTYRGTFYAGIIAGRGNNEKNVIGVAPKVKIAPLQFMDKTTASISELITAIDYANKMDIKILCLPIGFSQSTNALKDAIGNYDGLLVCVTNGNGHSNDLFPFYPASYHNDNILTVTASREDHYRRAFAGFGKITVDVAAPGRNVYSTMPYDKYDNTYLGPCTAVPHVAGIAALLLSKDKSLTPEEMKDAIMSSVKKYPQLIIIRSSGVVNAYNALKNIED
jgi:subtilisin family serine protease